MDRAERSAISARFATKVFTTRNGEDRIYINGLDGVKVWCVADEAGYPVAHYKSDWASCSSDDADAAMERAMERLGVRLNVSFSALVAIITGQKTVEQVNAEEATSEQKEAAQEEKIEEKEKEYPAQVQEWNKFSVNVQNILMDTGKACKIAFPHSSKLDGFCFWIPSSLVRGGRHSYENTVSMHRNMTFTAKKYGAEKWNKSEVIEERPVLQHEIIEAFGGEIEEKYMPKREPVEEVIIHTPEKLEPVNIEADVELVR